MFRIISRYSRNLNPNFNKITSKHGLKNYSTTNKNLTKVCLIGAGGGIGQPLSLLLKYQPKISELHLVDIADITGLGTDLSHIDTIPKIVTHAFTEIQSALENSAISVIVAGIPRKPGMTRDDLFRTNADIVGKIISEIAQLNQSMHIAIITNPVNSIVPFAYNLLSMLHMDKTLGKQSQKIYGVTTLDSVRANTFYAQKIGRKPSEVLVPVIGGHSENTIVPLLSYSNFPCTDHEIAQEIISSVREAGTKVVTAKQGKGSATLSMAYAATRFVNTLLDAHSGLMAYDSAFVASPTHKNLGFFGEMCCFTIEGVSNVTTLENITEFENKVIEETIPILIKDVEKGLDYSRVFYKNGPQTKA